MHLHLGLALMSLLNYYCLIILAEEPYPCKNLLLEPSELHKEDIAKQFVVLDAREKTKFSKSHIPNARWIDHTLWANSFNKSNNSTFWINQIGKLGIDNQTKVVVYDDNFTKDAARIWWILRYWGIEDVRLLNGGWNSWTKYDYTTSDDIEKINIVKFDLMPKQNRLATKEQILMSLKVGGLQIVDARSEKEFCGLEKMTNKRAGAIPGAIHLEWVDLIDKNTQRFKTPTELKKLFDDAGIDLAQPTATHCQSGGRAAVMAFTLELMGSNNVRNYYPSWAEWSNSEDTPVITGKPKEKK